MDNCCSSWVSCAIHNSLARHWRPSVFPTGELWRRQHHNKRVSRKLYQWRDSTLWLQALVYVCFFHGENVGEVFVVQEKQLAWFLCNLQIPWWVFEKSKLTANSRTCVVKSLILWSFKGPQSRYFELFWPSTKLPLNWRKPENNTLQR